MTPTRFDHVWAFDFGTASLGIAVRQGNKIRHAASLRLPEDFASTKDAATRRRMWRTRQAHKAREARWREIAAEAGIEVLNGRQVKPVDGQWRQVAKGDERLEREFPKKGDETCYTSCLLRIKLLRGDTDLQPWQVFKAIHSALQHRGYRDVPWGKNEPTRRKTDDKKEKDKIKAALSKYQREIEPLPEKFRYPCYLEAKRMKIWNPENPEVLELRIDHNAQRSRVDYENGETVGHIVPRQGVIEELRKLLMAASQKFPKLKGRENEILFGNGEMEFASYETEGRNQFLKKTGNKLWRGTKDDWQGVLGQKVPRFDNRIIEKCILIPEFNVCKPKPKDKKQNDYNDSLLPAQVVFLKKLKDLHVERNGKETGLTPEEIWTIFTNPTKPRVMEQLPPLTGRDEEIDGAHPLVSPSSYKIDKVEKWKQWCLKLTLKPCVNHEIIKPPYLGGRSRFCRPALRILKRLILCGQAPLERYDAEVARFQNNPDPKARGGLKDVGQLEFLKKMGGTWEGMFFPNERLAQLGKDAETKDERNNAIGRLISGVNNPVVRHRLRLFWDQLIELEQAYQTPNAVALEFVRNDFMGKDAKDALRNFQNRREIERNRARKMVQDFGLSTHKDAFIKLELLMQQGFQCVYKGTALKPTGLDELVIARIVAEIPNEDPVPVEAIQNVPQGSPVPLDSMEIDHIVPEAMQGPDAMFNKVVTTIDANREKKKRTPYEWLHATKEWDAYKNRVASLAKSLGGKKVKLLTSADAAKLAEKYTALAETAYIARLAQTLVCLHFGWPRSGEEGENRVIQVRGGLTARVRRKYHLNSILQKEGTSEEEAEKKNRKDDRHHALDAMVVSFLPQWMRDKQKERFFRFPFPKGEEREFFKQKIAEVVPEWVGREKPVLRETIYGARYDEEGILRHLVHRVPLVKVAYTGENPKYSVAYGLKAAAKIRDLWIQGQVIKFLQNEPDEVSWTEFCANLLHLNGSKISHIALREGDLKQAADLSKDKLKPRSGAWRVRKREHQGQFIYQDEDGKVQILPVLVFESKAKIFQKMLSEKKFKKIIGFFRSKDLVEITKPIPLSKGSRILPAGKYLVNTIESDGRAELEAANGETFRVGLTKLIEAGLCHVKKELS